MSKTLNNTATAKHIATQHGLTFSYVPRNRSWKLAARNHDSGKDMASVDYPARAVADIDTDSFYVDCMRIAALTISAAQMDKVVTRARYYEAQERADGRKLEPNSAEMLEYVRLSCAAESSDKQVHAMEDAIYCMRMDAEEISGTYGDHKFAHRAAPVAGVAGSVAMSAGVIVEVAAVGFDGGTDATDDRVLWVYAPSVEAVSAMLDRLNVPRLSISATDLDPNKVTKPEVLDLEQDAAELVARLYRFALSECGAALEATDALMAGYVGGTVERVRAKVRDARRIAAAGNDTLSN